MQITKDLVSKLKAVKIEKNLSLNNILDLLDQNGEYVSKTTLSRVFAEDSETEMFKPETLIPIARVLLDTENLEETDSIDEQALKTLLQYKSKRITELEQQIDQLQAALDHEKLHSHERLDEENERHQRSIDFLKTHIDFLKEQIDLKDRRYDDMRAAIKEKDAEYNKLLTLILSCPCRNKKE